MKRLVGVGAVLAVLAAVLFLIPSDHYLFLPDPARPVDPLVDVPGESRAGSEAGVYMVDILVRKASLFERLFPSVEEGASLVPGHAVNPVGVSETERRRESLNQMSRSQEIAVTVALRSLGRRVEVDETGAEVATIVPDSPADGTLEIGDVIVGVGGRPVRSPERLRAAMDGIRPGETVELTIVRGDRRRTVELPTTEAEDDPRRAVVGVVVQQAAEFEFPLEIEIDAGDVGGPSAGLAFALDVVDELGRDVDRGRRIAVTGELDLNGKVGAIGGIKQKTIGAREAGADVFVVPDDNADEARRHAEGLDILAVSTFEEALSGLATS